MTVQQLIKLLGNSDWDNVTLIQYLCNLRKQQLRILESNVYTVRQKKGEYEYLGYRDSIMDAWLSLNDPEISFFPSFGVAEHVSRQHDGSSVCVIPKKEFLTLPAFVRYFQKGLVTQEGHFNG